MVEPLDGVRLALAAFLLVGEIQRAIGIGVDAFQIDTYLVLVVLSIVTTLVGLAPVSLHRVLFRKRAKDSIVRYTDYFVQATLAGVALTVAGIGLLIFDLVLGRVWGIAFAVFIFLVVVVIWIVVPRRIRQTI